MTTKVETAAPGDSIKQSAILMLNKDFRRLPVLDDEKRLVGVVNSHDILTTFYRKLELNESDAGEFVDTRLSAYTWPNYSALSPSDSLGDAVKALHRKCVGCVTALRDTQLVGILTERDLVRLASQQNIAQRILEYMTRDFFRLQKSASVIDAMKYMVEMGIRRIPVFDGEELIGLVTEKDILSFVFNERTISQIGKAGAKVFRTTKLDQCMSTDFPKAFPEATVGYGAGLMLEGKKGCLIVHDGQRPRGIITEKDLINALLRL